MLGFQLSAPIGNRMPPTQTHCNPTTPKQAQLAKHDEPVLTTADIHKKAGVVDRACKPIATKPAPKPAPAPTVTEAAADATATATAAEGEVTEPAEGEEVAMDADGEGAAAGGEPMEEA
jgi:heat shock protein 4